MDVTAETLRLAWMLLTNERGRQPDFRSIGVSRTLIYGTILDGNNYLPFTVNPLTRTAKVHAEASDRCFNYAVLAAAQWANDIEEGDRENPHR